MGAGVRGGPVGPDGCVEPIGAEVLGDPVGVLANAGDRGGTSGALVGVAESPVGSSENTAAAVRATDKATGERVIWFAQRWHVFAVKPMSVTSAQSINTDAGRGADTPVRRGPPPPGDR